MFSISHLYLYCTVTAPLSMRKRSRDRRAVRLGILLETPTHPVVRNQLHSTTAPAFPTLGDGDLEPSNVYFCKCVWVFLLNHTSTWLMPQRGMLNIPKFSRKIKIWLKGHINFYYLKKCTFFLYLILHCLVQITAVSSLLVYCQFVDF